MTNGADLRRWLLAKVYYSRPIRPDDGDPV